MRAYDIALFIALFTAATAIVNDISSLDVYETPNSNLTVKSDDFMNITGEIVSSSDDSFLSNDHKISYTSLLTALSKLDDYILIKTVILNTFATNIDKNSEEYKQINNIANIFQIGCGFVYMFAFVQLWRKISIKGMQ